MEGWELYKDGEQRLRLSRNYRAKNFVKVRALTNVVILLAS